ncbi:MAG TPA: hypothetical protein VKB65_07620, partial [Myxococcota bacterium]|nr:hypothetical protein [Myxococcota bacterium]
VGHCELLPREALAPMVEFQRARDARLALALLRGAGESGRAVLVAGNGHVRDGDVPALLERAGVARDAIVNVGLLEAGPEADVEADHFDFAFFTPEAEREDPCEALRERLGGRDAAVPGPSVAIGQGRPASPTPAGPGSDGSLVAGRTAG